MLKPASPRRASRRALSFASGARAASSQSEVGERAGADRDRRTADRPRAESGAEATRNVRRSDGEAQPKPREPVGLAERAQDDGAARGQRRFEGLVGAVEIREGFVDDQHSAARKKPGVKIEEVGASRGPPVRIVWIDDDRDVEAFHGVERGRVLNNNSSGGEGGGVTAVGWPERGDAPNSR